MSDIDTAAVDSLKALDPNRPIREADIEALAASIAANGMLQSPVVEPEMKNGTPTGSYLVTIGEGRRQAEITKG